MKGATALLSASTSRAPNITMTIRSGRSQNLFRTLRNFQNSLRNDIGIPLSTVAVPFLPLSCPVYGTLPGRAPALVLHLPLRELGPRRALKQRVDKRRSSCSAHKEQKTEEEKHHDNRRQPPALVVAK